MANFPCIRCGICCRRIDIAVRNAEKIGLDNFPFRWDETGKCEMLGEDNMCMVYNNRPLLCNIEKIAEVYGFDKKEFYNLNIQSCNSMLESENRTERIKLIT